MKSIIESKACRTCGNTFMAVVYREGIASMAVVECKDCLDKVAAAERWADHQRRKQQAMREWQDTFPKLYRQSDVVRFPVAWDIIKAWRPDEVGRGLLLVGPTEHHKTRMLTMLARDVMAEGHPVKFLQEPEFADMAWSKSTTTLEWLRGLEKVSVLFIDDIGKALGTDRNASLLYRIVERRTSTCRPIWATTNYTGDELAGRQNDQTQAIVRRLREFCEVIKV